MNLDLASNALAAWKYGWRDRSWAPLGAARMELLVKEDFFNGLPVAFFRNIKSEFVSQATPPTRT
jgi:hypothetical protein